MNALRLKSREQRPMREHQAESLTGAIAPSWSGLTLLRLGLALALLLLSACMADDPGPGNHALVVGQADLPAELVAAGGILRVRLKDPALGGRVLGESTVKGAEGDRIPFVIRYDPKQIAAGHAYQLEAEVTGRDGRRFAAVLPIEVDPRDQQEVQLALAPARGGPGQAEGPAGLPEDADQPAGTGTIVLPAGAPEVSR
jgi:hypothetical protein